MFFRNGRVAGRCRSTDATSWRDLRSEWESLRARSAARVMPEPEMVDFSSKVVTASDTRDQEQVPLREIVRQRQMEEREGDSC